MALLRTIVCLISLLVTLPAMAQIRGEPIVHEVDTEITIDEPLYLPDDYVSDVGLRLSLYKRFASAESESEVSDLAAEMEAAELGQRILERRTADIHLIKCLYGRQPCGAALVGGTVGLWITFGGVSHCRHSIGPRHGDHGRQKPTP